MSESTTRTLCRCGHQVSDHAPLPGHPDGALECYGSDDCECGQLRFAPTEDRRG